MWAHWNAHTDFGCSFGETSPSLYAGQFWEQILLLAKCRYLRSGCFCLNFYLTNFLLSAFTCNFLWFLKRRILLIVFNLWEVLIAVFYSVVKTLVISIEGNYKLKLLLLGSIFLVFFCFVLGFLLLVVWVFLLLLLFELSLQLLC